MSTSVQAQPAERLTVQQIAERGRMQEAERECRAAEEEAREQGERDTRARKDLAKYLQRYLELTVDAATAMTRAEEGYGRYAIVTVDGYTFAYRQPNYRRWWSDGDSTMLVMESTCDKGC